MQTPVAKAVHAAASPSRSSRASAGHADGWRAGRSCLALLVLLLMEEATTSVTVSLNADMEQLTSSADVERRFAAHDRTAREPKTLQYMQPETLAATMSRAV